jgi:hypothetical protein
MRGVACSHCPREGHGPTPWNGIRRAAVRTDLADDEMGSRPRTLWPWSKEGSGVGAEGRGGCVRVIQDRGHQIRMLGPWICHRRHLTVRKVVPTLTSMSAKISLSMAGAKQHTDTGFILVSRQCIALHRGACRGGYKHGGRGGEASRSLRFD